MDFKQSITTCLRKYADFNGRGSRSEYWWFALFGLLVHMAASAVLKELGGQLATVALLLPSLAAGSRRLHDMGKSGWFQLLWLVPVLGWIAVIYWLVQPTAGPNRWGEGPDQPQVPARPPGAT